MGFLIALTYSYSSRKWDVVAVQVQDSKEFKELMETNGSTPRELFEDRVEALQEPFDKLKHQVKDTLKDYSKVW